MENGITFYVAETGTEAKIQEVLSEEEYFDRETFPVNHNWYPVRVRHEADKERWVGLRNEWLRCAWTPNQTDVEKEEWGARMKEIEEEIKGLVINYSY